MKTIIASVGYGLALISAAGLYYHQCQIVPSIKSYPVNNELTNSEQVVTNTEASDELASINREIEELQSKLETLQAQDKITADRETRAQEFRQQAYTEAKESYEKEYPIQNSFFRKEIDLYSEEEQRRRKNNVERRYRNLLIAAGIENPRLDNLIAQLIDAELQHDLLQQQRERGEITKEEYDNLAKVYNQNKMIEAALSPPEFAHYKEAQSERAVSEERKYFSEDLAKVAPNLSEAAQTLVTDTYLGTARENPNFNSFKDPAKFYEKLTEIKLERIQETLTALEPKLKPDEMEWVNHFFQFEERKAIQSEKLMKTMLEQQNRGSN